MTIIVGSGDITIDATNPDNLSDKVLAERETRKRLLTHARLAEVERGVKGLEKAMMLLFAKYDKMMRTCSNDKERMDMGKLGAIEMYRLLGGGGELYVNSELVC